VVTVACILWPNAVWSADEEGHGGLPHHHVAVIAGGGVETESGHPDRAGFALGISYEFRFHEKWGIGASVDALGQNTRRDSAVAVPVSYHLTERWRLFAGPGVEFADGHNELLIRLGVGYEFRLSGRWTLAPEFVADFVEGGKKLFIGGVALGYEF
jgi:opacity protein-like surface antigen